MATMAEAKRDFDRGLIQKFLIEKTMGGYLIQLGYSYSGGAELEGLVDARERRCRVFKTLDAAVAVIQAVGFEVRQLSLF